MKIKNILRNKMVMIQVIIVVLVLLLLFVFYPRINHIVNGNIVSFNSANSEYVIVSKSSDFSNPKYVNFEGKDIFVELEPGTYYWKGVNNFVNGFTNRLIIESEVGLRFSPDEDSENEASIENIGNVKINITKTDEGVTIGEIRLVPDEFDIVENKGEYIGREE